MLRSQHHTVTIQNLCQCDIPKVSHNLFQVQPNVTNESIFFIFLLRQVVPESVQIRVVQMMIVKVFRAPQNASRVRDRVWSALQACGAENYVRKSNRDALTVYYAYQISSSRVCRYLLYGWWWLFKVGNRYKHINLRRTND